MFRTSHILVLFVLIPSTAAALDGLVECPTGNEDKPRVTHAPQWQSGFPLAETFAMEIAGKRFDVPIGYLRPWPPPQFYRSQPFRSSKGFQFSFWMPDGRMPELDTWFNVMRRPCEAGRPEADAEHFIVDGKFRSLGSGDYRERWSDDEFVLSNLKEQFDFDSQVNRTVHGDMIEYDPHVSVYCLLSAPDASFDAVATCSKTTKAPNVSCGGDIRFHGDDYALNIQIPRDSVQKFEDAAKMARNLVESWNSSARGDE